MSPTSQAEQILATFEAIDDALDSREGIAERFERCLALLVDGLDSPHVFAWFFVMRERGGLCEPSLLSRASAGPMGLDQLREDPRLLELVERSRASAGVERVTLEGEQLRGDLMVQVVEPELGPSWVMGAIDAKHEHAARVLAGVSRSLAKAVTHSKMLEHIERADQRVHDLVGASDVAVLIIDLGTQRVVEVNSRAESLFGWPPGQLLGAELNELNPSEQPDGKASELRITELLAEVGVGRRETFAWTFRHADGEQLPCRADMSLVPNSERLLIHAAITSA